MAIRNAESPTVTVRESDLLEAVIVALESDEFRQIRGRMYGRKGERCAYGVVKTVLHRAGLRENDWPAEVVEPMQRAAHAFGHGDISMANDAGCTFAQIAQALREAREEMTHG